jgi:hypothetical protein
MKDGGWANTDKGWVLHPSQQERVRLEHVANMARIDKIQAGYPECALCGQRTIKLDRFGLCSRISEPHKAWRAEALADEKAEARR